MEKITEDFLEQLLKPYISDRLAEVYTKDEIYQGRVKEEELIYQKLLEELSDEQAEDLEQYFIATSSTAARKETLTYQQGMKDLLLLLKHFSK